jgi:DNA recombination protein RmuC
MELIAITVLTVALLVLAFLSLRRSGEAAALASAESAARTLGQLQADVARLVRQYEDLSDDVQRTREASLLQLAQTAQGLRGEIGQTQRALAEVKALELGRAQQMDRAAESLRRIEIVMAGSATRGVAGENVLGRSLGQLPADLLAVNVPFGSKVVEYALRLPGGRLLPIDSKWSSLDALERLEASSDPEERGRLVAQMTRELRARAREAAKYVDPERTLGVAIVAVPDAVYWAAPEAHAEGHREGVLVAPVSLTLPLALALYRFALRLGAAIDVASVSSALRAVAEALVRLEDEIEGRLSRALVQAANARDDLRREVAAALRVTTGLLGQAERESVPQPDHPADTEGAKG